MNDVEHVLELNTIILFTAPTAPRNVMTSEMSATSITGISWIIIAPCDSKHCCVHMCNTHSLW